MAAGLEIYNADGSLQMHIGSRAFRVITVADIGATTSGTISADLTGGTPVVGMEGSGGDAKAPALTVTPTGVSWNYGSIPVPERDSALRLSVVLY